MTPPETSATICGHTTPPKVNGSGFTSRLASKVYFDAAPGRTMRDLRDILAGKDVFVLTTNADDAFELAGFNPEQVFALESGVGEMRCSAHCTNEVKKDLDAAARMAAAEKDGRVPSELIPRCERCGSPMEPNHADGDAFFSSPFWRNRAEAFSRFVEHHAGQNIVVLEIGVGRRNQMLLRSLRSSPRRSRMPRTRCSTCSLGRCLASSRVNPSSWTATSG